MCLIVRVLPTETRSGTSTYLKEEREPSAARPRAARSAARNPLEDGDPRVPRLDDLQEYLVVEFCRILKHENSVDGRHGVADDLRNELQSQRYRIRIT